MKTCLTLCDQNQNKKKRSCNHNHLCDDWKKLNHVTAEHDMTKV